MNMLVKIFILFFLNVCCLSKMIYSRDEFTEEDLLSYEDSESSESLKSRSSSLDSEFIKVDDSFEKKPTKKLLSGLNLFRFKKLIYIIKYGDESKYLSELYTFIKHNKKSLQEVDKHGMTPLHWAIQKDKPLFVKTLLEEGADVNAVTKKGVSPLMGALALMGDSYSFSVPKKSQIIDMLLDAGAAVNVRSKQKMKTPLLHFVVYRQNSDLLKKVLAYNADVNSIDESGNTPLMIAIKLKALDLIKILIEHGADVTITANKNKKTPLIEAVDMYAYEFDQCLEGKKKELVQRRLVLLDQKQHQALSQLDQAILQDLNKALAIVRSEIEKNNGVLWNTLKIIRTLLSAKHVNWNQKDYYGRTALSIAQREGLIQIIELFKAK